MFYSKLILTHLFTFIFLCLSEVKCDNLVWLDANSKSKKIINLENGELSIETKPRQFYRLGQVKFPENFQKDEFLNQKIQYCVDGKLNYFLIKELNILYLLDEEHGQFQRFDFAKVSSDVFFDSSFGDFQFDTTFVLANLLILVLLIFAFKWMYKFFTSGESKTRKPKHLDELLQIFVLNGSDYTCTTLTINEIIKIEKKSYETQRQLRSKFIRGVNKYLLEQYNIKNAIVRVTSSEDRRFVNYQISKHAYDKLLQHSSRFSM